MEKAKRLATKDDISDEKAIREIGEGWVAEETLAIAIYCSLKYRKDFEKAIIASVNHDGDSDSTGSITGSIMGAMLGYEYIPKKYLNNLELREVVEDVANDLYKDCPMKSEFDSKNWDKVWEEKYIKMSYHGE